MNMADINYLPLGETRVDEPMARHTSWRAGGAAACAYFPAGLEDLRGYLAALPAEEPVLFVGLGSNLLVRDGGLKATVIFTQNALNALRVEEGMLYAEAGVASPKAARHAAQRGYAGAEFLAGVPGTVGGALAMNAGCYGGETWNIVSRVLTVDRSGVLHERTRADYDIGYRHVRALHGAEEWFVAAYFSLQPGDGERALADIKVLQDKRMASQPLDQPNAGSVFRNPPGTHAARLIEAAGLKGRRIGGAMISDKHANFIVNLGTASAADIEALIELAADTVREHSGIALEREVRIVGGRA